MSNLSIANEDYMDLRVVRVTGEPRNGGTIEWGYREEIPSECTQDIMVFDPPLPRTASIGASDAAALMGLNKYKSPDQLYEMKVGNAPEDEDNESMAQGRQQEAGVGYWYALLASKDGPAEYFYPGKIHLSHPDMQWVSCTPDALVRQNGEVHGLEIKTASEYRDQEFGIEGSADVPLEYYMQCQWSMLVMGLQRWDLAVRVGGNKVRIYTIPRHDETISEMMSVAERMWVDHIKKRVPPPASGHVKYMDTFKERNPSPGEAILQANDIDQSLVDSLTIARQVLDDATHTHSRIKNAIIERIGSNKGIEGAGWRVTLSRYPKKSTKWSAVAKDAGASKALINKHTTTSEVCQFNNRKTKPKTKPKKEGK